MFSAFSKAWLPPELRQVLSCESPAVFLHFPIEEKGPWGPFFQLRWVLTKGRHLLEILLNALHVLMHQKRQISLPVGYKTARPKTGHWE